jgi:hypothetical protein
VLKVLEDNNINEDSLEENNIEEDPFADFGSNIEISDDDLPF